MKGAITPKTIVVNVNRHVIAANRKHARNDPVFRIQRGKSGKAEMARGVAILDAQGAEVARFIYGDGDVLLKCGARAVLIAHHNAVAIEDGFNVLTSDESASNDAIDDKQ